MESIYPLIKTEQEVKEMIDKSLNQSRITEMNNKRLVLEKDLKRYKKLMKRWKKVNKGFIISGVILVGLTGIGTIITSAVIPPVLLIPIFTPIVPIVLGSLGVVETITFTSLELGIFKRKIDFYDRKSKMIQSYIDKLYYYIEKAKEDSIITIDELNGFRNIMDDYRNKISQIEEKDIDPKIFRAARHEANKELQ